MPKWVSEPKPTANAMASTESDPCFNIAAACCRRIRFTKAYGLMPVCALNSRISCARDTVAAAAISSIFHARSGCANTA